MYVLSTCLLSDVCYVAFAFPASNTVQFKIISLSTTVATLFTYYEMLRSYKSRVTMNQPHLGNKKKLLLNQKQKKELRELLGSAFLSINISFQLFLGVCVGVCVCVICMCVCMRTINLLRTFSLSVYVDKCQSLRGLFAKSVITWGILPSGEFLLAQITSLVTQSNQSCSKMHHQ